jgi:hypothetical protein
MNLLKTTVVALGFISSSNAISLSPAFTEDFESSTSTNFFYGSGGGQADFTHLMGVASKSDPSLKVLALSMDTNDPSGAWQGPNMTSNGLTQYGRYSTRLKIPEVSIQPLVGAVVGFYTYYNDQWGNSQDKDINNNGIMDNSEIDIEWLIADPEVLYLSAYTDYDGNTGETRKVSRVLNLAKGTIYSTESAKSLGGMGIALSGKENLPTTIPSIPGFDASQQFYTYGFDWTATSIRWWIIDPSDGDTLVLWDYQGPQERITTKPASLMLNIWHTSDWGVITNTQALQKPESIFTVEMDWVKYQTFDDITNVNRFENSIHAQIVPSQICNLNGVCQKLQFGLDGKAVYPANLSAGRYFIQGLGGEKSWIVIK